MTITTEEPGFFLPPPEMHKLPYDGSFWGGTTLVFGNWFEGRKDLVAG